MKTKQDRAPRFSKADPECRCEFSATGERLFYCDKCKAREAKGPVANVRLTIGEISEIVAAARQHARTTALLQAEHGNHTGSAMWETKELGIADAYRAICEAVYCGDYPRIDAEATAETSAIDLLNDVLIEWGGYGDDDEINGADAVDWLVGFVKRIRKALALTKVPPAERVARLRLYLNNPRFNALTCSFGKLFEDGMTAVEIRAALDLAIEEAMHTEGK